SPGTSDRSHADAKPRWLCNDCARFATPRSEAFFMVRLLLIVGLVLNFFACASTPERAEPAATPPVAESPPPAAEPVYEPAPGRELPKRGSPLPLIGLSGLAALAGAGALHVVRSRIR